MTSEKDLIKEAEDRARRYTGTMCSVCNQPQLRSPSGVTCANGHGGANSIDPKTGDVVFLDDFDSRDLPEPVEEEGSYRIHVEVSLEPASSGDDERRSDHDPVGLPVDLDDLRMRRDAGHDAAVEVAGRLLPRLVEAIRRLLW